MSLKTGGRMKVVDSICIGKMMSPSTNNVETCRCNNFANQHSCILHKNAKKIIITMFIQKSYLSKDLLCWFNCDVNKNKTHVKCNISAVVLRYMYIKLFTIRKSKALDIEPRQRVYHHCLVSTGLRQRNEGESFRTWINGRTYLQKAKTCHYRNQYTAHVRINGNIYTWQWFCRILCKDISTLIAV